MKPKPLLTVQAQLLPASQLTCVNRPLLQAASDAAAWSNDPHETTTLQFNSIASCAILFLCCAVADAASLLLAPSNSRQLWRSLIVVGIGADAVAAGFRREREQLLLAGWSHRVCTVQAVPGAADFQGLPPLLWGPASSVHCKCAPLTPLLTGALLFLPLVWRLSPRVFSCTLFGGLCVCVWGG